MIPFVPSVGVIPNVNPEQVFKLIGLLDALGLRLMVSVNRGPLQAPETGRTV